MPAELLAAMVLLGLRVQPEHPEVRAQQAHKAQQDLLEIQVQKETQGMMDHKAHKDRKDRQGLRVLGSAMEMPRETSSTGMGLPGRT